MSAPMPTPMKTNGSTLPHVSAAEDNANLMRSRTVGEASGPASGEAPPLASSRIWSSMPSRWMTVPPATPCPPQSVRAGRR